MSKLNKFLTENNYKTIRFLYNNSFVCGSYSVCGSRGWYFDIENEKDERVLLRELGRIERSLQSAEKDNKIVFLHYPPVTQNSKCTQIIDLLEKYGIKKCYFGHLHGDAAKYAFEGKENGIDFKLISCDRLKFTPYLILKY